MTPDRAPAAALLRVGAGLLAGAALLVPLGLLLLAEIAALVVLGVALASWAAEQRWPRLAGLWVGLVGAAGFLLVDLQLATAGGSVPRSAGITAVVGLAVLATALAVDAGVLEGSGR